jgi:uroporphyrinogen decarboxylase
LNRLQKKLQKNKFLSAPLVGYPACKLNDSTARENLTNADIQIDTLLKYYNRLKPDILFPFMDLAVEVESLGLETNIKENDPPEVIEHPIRQKEDLEGLAKTDISQEGRFNIYIETINKLRIESEAAISGYVTSPFTMAGLLTGAERIAARTITRPDFISSLIEFSMEISLEYARLQEKAGADCIVLLDPTASLLSPELFRDFVTPYIDNIAAQLNIPVVLHVCGDTTPLIDEFINTKMAGLSLDYGVNLKEIMPRIPENILVMGNIDPVRTVFGGNPKSIFNKTSQLISDLKEYDNFIPATGCDVPPKTEFENIHAFQRAVNQANRKYKNIKV